MTVGSDSAGAAAVAACNTIAAANLGSGYFATADPADVSMRFFGTNTSGTVFFGAAALAMTDTSATASATPPPVTARP